MAVGFLSFDALALFGAILFRNGSSTHAFGYHFFMRVPRSPGHGQIVYSSINSVVHLATSDNIVTDEFRRQILCVAMAAPHVFVNGACPNSGRADNSQLITSIHGVHDVQLKNYVNPNFPNWKGTSLDVMSLQDAAQRISKQSNLNPTLPMGRWPDPILRRPTASIPSTVFQSSTQIHQLRSVAMALKNTAMKERAVGLAAQQCGIDASLIYIRGVKEKRRLDKTGDVQNSKKFFEGSSLRKLSNIPQYSHRDSGIFLINPRIIQRSSESDMMVWTEECLVLPPEFRATLLRDAQVTIEYETLGIDTEDVGQTRQITLSGELARCAQHEMDHDRGVLIVDHVGLSELLSIGEDMFMANIENSDGLHESRMQRAYARDISKSMLLSKEGNHFSSAFASVPGVRSGVADIGYSIEFTTDKQTSIPWFIGTANAMENSPLPLVSEGSSEFITSQTTNRNKRNAVTLECDSTCLERRRIIESRRAMMSQSRSNTRRL